MKLSIITINRNNASGLKKTIESVVTQSCTDFEYIVIDGASTDESIDIIKSYSDKISYWVSEPDTGIYNAMNKGVLASHGEYTLMLNSGDYLVDCEVINVMLPHLYGVDIIQGNTISQNKGNIERQKGYGKSNITFIDVMRGHFLHQASFCRKELFETYGLFDETYKINGDTVFFAKCLAFGNATFKYLDIDISYFDITGISSDPNGKWIDIRKREDERYVNMFSIRMWDLCITENKKIELYNNLRAHKWSWGITMLIIRVCNFIYSK